MLRRITGAKSRDLNCYMIHVKKDNHFLNLSATPQYMFRWIPIAGVGI